MVALKKKKYMHAKINKYKAEIINTQ